MGLDMYLESYKKTNDKKELITFSQLEEFYTQYDDIKYGYTKDVTTDYVAIALEKATQFLKDNNVINSFQSRGKSMIWESPFKEEIYWRKSNAIHVWFVNNVQNDEDDCKRYAVSKEKIIELRDRCKEITEDNTKAKDLLPTQGGFFFGGIDYDKWYYQDIALTYHKLSILLIMFHFETRQLIYNSSW